MSSANYQQHGSTAVITLDNPPVNGLGYDLRCGIVAGIDRASADPAVTAVVLIGSDRAFSGGADIREFGSPKSYAEPNLLTVIRIVEACPKPVVAAVGGVCMGGGLELALGAHFRVAVAGASIALPEIKLGLLPGAGGTQRMPRIIGVEAALNLILSGNPVPSEKFKGTPLSELTSDAVRGLAEHWMPKAKVAPGKSPEDIMLIAAVTKRLEEIEKAEDPSFDDVPF